MTCSVLDKNSELCHTHTVLGWAVPFQTRDAVNVDMVSWMLGTGQSLSLSLTSHWQTWLNDKLDSNCDHEHGHIPREHLKKKFWCQETVGLRMLYAVVTSQKLESELRTTDFGSAPCHPRMASECPDTLLEFKLRMRHICLSRTSPKPLWVLYKHILSEGSPAYSCTYSLSTFVEFSSLWTNQKALLFFL